MRRLLISTTALSVALSQVAPLPLMAQTVTEDGSIIADDGRVLCEATADAPCDLNAVLEQLAAEAQAAAQAEAEAAAAAEAEAAAQAEAEAAAAAEAGEDAATEEPSLGEAIEEILTEEPPADPAAAEAAIIEEAPAEGVVTEEAPSEEVPAEVAPEESVEDAPADSVVDAPAEAVSPDEGGTEAPPAEEAGSEAAEGESVAEEEAPAPVEAVTDPAVLVDPAATEAPPAEAVETLSELLAQPEGVAPEALEAAATLAPVAPTDGGPLEIAPSSDATDVLVQEITEETARSSAQDFAAPASASLAAATAASNDDGGLTDLQKFGLVALGALAVGAIINANRDQVVSNTGDRVVVQRGNGDYYIYKDDDTLLRRPGSTVRTESFRDGSTRTIVERADGTQIVTIRDATGRVLRRATYDSLGREVVLIDDLYPEERIDVRTLPQPRGRVISLSTSEEDALLRARMAALDAEELGRTFSLRQVREIPQVRRLAATVDVNNITFDTGSAAIKATQAESLAALGRLMTSMIAENPNEIFLIEGHTDAVGAASLNLTLSDRRAESVALALTEYFDVPPENMVVQGYGESDLRVNTDEAERQNRRVAVRIITPLLRTAAVQ